MNSPITSTGNSYNTVTECYIVQKSEWNRFFMIGITETTIKLKLDHLVAENIIVTECQIMTQLMSKDRRGCTKQQEPIWYNFSFISSEDLIPGVCVWHRVTGTLLSLSVNGYVNLVMSFIPMNGQPKHYWLPHFTTNHHKNYIDSATEANNQNQ